MCRYWNLSVVCRSNQFRNMSNRLNAIVYLWNWNHLFKLSEMCVKNNVWYIVKFWPLLLKHVLCNVYALIETRFRLSISLLVASHKKFLFICRLVCFCLRQDASRIYSHPIFDSNMLKIGVKFSRGQTVFSLDLFFEKYYPIDGHRQVVCLSPLPVWRKEHSNMFFLFYFDFSFWATLLLLISGFKAYYLFHRF